MHLGEGPFINVTLELQVVVCFGQGSNGLRIILHLVLRSLLNKSVQDVHFIQREALGQLLAYCLIHPESGIQKHILPKCNKLKISKTHVKAH